MTFQRKTSEIDAPNPSQVYFKTKKQSQNTTHYIGLWPTIHIARRWKKIGNVYQ
jgi:hypothetical protein